MENAGDDLLSNKLNQYADLQICVVYVKRPTTAQQLPSNYRTCSLIFCEELYNSVVNTQFVKHVPLSERAPRRSRPL